MIKFRSTVVKAGKIGGSSRPAMAAFGGAVEEVRLEAGIAPRFFYEGWTPRRLLVHRRQPAIFASVRAKRSLTMAS
jgi:hypothetical protein